MWACWLHCISELPGCSSVLQACGADAKAVSASDDRRLRLEVLSGHVRAALLSENFSTALQGGLSCTTARSLSAAKPQL
jgi:hypothetical protein